MRATTLKSNTNAFTYVGITTTEDFADVVYSGVSSAFVAITTSGNTYVSVAGTSWTKQTSDLYSVGSGTTITDLFYNQSINRLVAVGATSAESIFTDSVPEEISATATATVNGDGNVTGITLTNLDLDLISQIHQSYKLHLLQEYMKILKMLSGKETLVK